MKMMATIPIMSLLLLYTRLLCACSDQLRLIRPLSSQMRLSPLILRSRRVSSPESHSAIHLNRFMTSSFAKSGYGIDLFISKCALKRTESERCIHWIIVAMLLISFLEKDQVHIKKNLMKKFERLHSLVFFIFSYSFSGCGSSSCCEKSLFKNFCGATDVVDPRRTQSHSKKNEGASRIIFPWLCFYSRVPPKKFFRKYREF